jgi:carbon storage regulator
MLVLSRKHGESVRIADNIEVVVLEIKNGKVRLGFRCPDEVPVLRREVYDRNAAEELLSLMDFTALVEA